MKTESISENQIISQLRGAQAPVERSDPNQLKQEDFLALLTKQLAHQDPTKPVENDQMISQMTSFSIASGIEAMASDIQNLTNAMSSGQALQASSLIGRDVLVPSDAFVLTEGQGAKGLVAVPDVVQNATVRIENEQGEHVRTLDLGTLEQGAKDFEWDGKNSDGEDLPSGNYIFKAEAFLPNGEKEALNVASYTKVNSVNIGSAGSAITVNTEIGPIGYADIIEIAE